MINQGVAFGFLPGLSVWIFGLVLAGLAFYAVKMRELWGRVGVVLIILGGVGNLVSRILYGGVVDNLNFFGLVYNNYADYLIGMGVILYGYSYYFRR